MDVPGLIALSSGVMNLPDPIPDDPRKWEGWRTYSSSNYYERLGLASEDSPSDTQIEENCRRLLVWWQKKLPLKNQPSNPLAQLLRDGLDEAPQRLVEARSILLNPKKRATVDEQLAGLLKDKSIEEFRKFVNFTISGGLLRASDEDNLLRMGQALALEEDEMFAVIGECLHEKGASREEIVEEAPVQTPIFGYPPQTPGQVSTPVIPQDHQTPVYQQPHGQPSAPGYNTPVPGYPSPIPVPGYPGYGYGYQMPVPYPGYGYQMPPGYPQALPTDPREEFKRILMMSGLMAEGLNEDQRRAFLQMAVNMGIDEDDADDIIDTALDEADILDDLNQGAGSSPGQPASSGPATINMPKSTPAFPGRGGSVAPNGQKPPDSRTSPRLTPRRQTTPNLAPAQEKRQYPNFTNCLGMEMRLIPSGEFEMGSEGTLAKGNEKPKRKVTLDRFYMARFPVTNEQYELFDPRHKMKRMEWAEGDHPVVSVLHKDAMDFCDWLTSREGEGFIYRLPTEAEWEYAARGTDFREYPWGNSKGRSDLANFADVNAKLAWSDSMIDDGYAYTSPVGAFPRGASAFGIEDMGGNVWEWCQDYYGPYREDDVINPKGAVRCDKRVCRGGSFRAKFSSLRCAARQFNQINYQFIDLGFRVVRECDPR